MKLLKSLFLAILVMVSVLISHPASSTEDFKQVTLIEGLEHPWSLAWLPDGQMLITERPGRLRLVKDGQLDPTPIAGVPEVLAAGQGGLLEVSVHPRFQENRLIYLTYAAGSTNANQTTLARGVLNGKTLENVEVIFTVSQTKTGTQHFGSRLLWLPDNTLLMSIGDGGNPPLELDGNLIREQAQNLQSQLGKIIRIKDDGSIPADNPFVDNPEVDPRIWSYGHRNIQGLAFDPVSDRLWASEHGARGGDELNLLQKGQNYGWPIVSESREYSTGEPVSEQSSQPGMVEPKKVWTPAIAPSGLAVYQGELLVGGLVSQSVQRLQVGDNGAIIQEEVISFPQRVRDVRVGPDGFIYILTDAPQGKLLRLEPLNP